MRWLKFQKSHRTSRALPICGNALSHLAIIIESSSQKDDYHNRHIKRSPGRGLFSEQCSRQNGGKQRGATSKKNRKHFLAAWPFSQKGQPVQKVHQKCEKVCQRCEKVHWEALEFLLLALLPKKVSAYRKASNITIQTSNKFFLSKTINNWPLILTRPYSLREP